MIPDTNSPWTKIELLLIWLFCEEVKLIAWSEFPLVEIVLFIILREVNTKMKRKAILLRNHSQESREAEKILKENNIDYAPLFSTSEGRLPSIISPDSAYAYRGLEDIRLFVRSAKRKLNYKINHCEKWVIAELLF